MSYKDVYDFEGAIEKAVSAVFTDQEIVCFTPQGDPQFQKNRPRVEATFIPGPGRQQYILVADDFTDGNSDYPHRRESSFGGQLTLSVITDGENGMSAHADYRSKIRNVMSTFQRTVNGLSASVMNHKVQQIRENGSSNVYGPQEGYYQTTLNYDLEFSIQANAWLQLNQ